MVLFGPGRLDSRSCVCVRARARVCVCVCARARVVWCERVCGVVWYGVCVCVLHTRHTKQSALFVVVTAVYFADPSGTK